MGGSTADTDVWWKMTVQWWWFNVHILKVNSQYLPLPLAAGSSMTVSWWLNKWGPNLWSSTFEQTALTTAPGPPPISRQYSRYPRVQTNPAVIEMIASELCDECSYIFCLNTVRFNKVRRKNLKSDLVLSPSTLSVELMMKVSCIVKLVILCK